ncbi:hypothetical protein [Streptomyces sp. TRM49041]|uniref:hypothetical protein n=1 Tax=Streptomyces sp. TRM49041 TaxID=2603216 RepID=UPI0011ED0DF7|nr:hypothetical protein [Streptomyces sp. TRM49041]
MSTDRTVSRILQQIATQDVVEITDSATATGRVAAQVHLVEQYGFEYGEARRHGHNKQLLTVFLYRDANPEARAREAATIAAYPQAGNGGAAPGLLPGTLKPLPEAEAAVALAKDRIAFDVMGQAAEPRQKTVAWAMLGVAVVVILIAGKYLVALGAGVFLGGLLLGFFKLGEARRQKLAQRLQAAGLVAVRDEHGIQRFLRPGRQLPGHANPFAG